jgi:Bacterial Ig-like domain (group 3)
MSSRANGVSGALFRKLALAAGAVVAAASGLLSIGVAPASATGLATTTTLTASPSTPGPSQSTTFVAVVAGPSNANLTTVGVAGTVVTFYLDVDGSAGHALCSSSGETITYAGSGTSTVTEAICTTTGGGLLTAGAHTLYADFSDTSGTYQSSSASQSLTVAAAVSTEAVVVSPVNPVVNVPATITATLSPSGINTGTVTFYDDFDGNGADVLCSNVAVSSSQASCQYTWSSVFAHTVYADYSGGSADGSASASTSADVGLTTLNQSLFANANQPGNWYLPSQFEFQAGTNGPVYKSCLTAGSTTGGAPIPGCGLGSPNAVGSGVLRLTNNDSTIYDTNVCTGNGVTQDTSK